MAPNARIFPNQLEQALQRGLSSGYLIFGDEPLQRFESIASIVNAARQQGFDEVERLYLDSTDAIAELSAALQGMSLFASKRVIVLDMGNGKCGKDIGAILNDYGQYPSPDLIVICHGSKLEKAQQNTKWFKALSAISQAITIAAPSGDRLTNWLRHRARAAGVQLAPDALMYLQEHHEGNLLSLSQELEKLSLLHDQSPISVEQLHQALIDQSRFDIFQLTDAIMAGQVHQVEHMLRQLKDEGIEPVIICWALSREVAQLQALMMSPDQQPQLFKKFRIWPSRQPTIKRALQQLSVQRIQQAVMLVALLERKVKGAETEQSLSWTLITQACSLLMNPAANVDWLLTAELS
ncbi:DNA polymerase III subunit delta [Echinimonas agarilytica]|uniref:DNA polymerase III subunit delta n=1 Tax=Echinimonas agarilytica TaxID=1215918 RepID=A0AA42B6R1_9GAMM|nr:DNA polymerase III subunit delta [Echinimonas agarilytica]MCM2679087.1 DNA polymerase III subunit delta [Echinimonas agarilytica]